SPWCPQTLECQRRCESNGRATDQCRTSWRREDVAARHEFGVRVVAFFSALKKRRVVQATDNLQDLRPCELWNQFSDADSSWKAVCFSARGGVSWNSGVVAAIRRFNRAVYAPSCPGAHCV